MRRITIVIGCMWLMLVTASTSSAQGWRGIIPLRSTRQDVARLLGNPTDYYYYLKNETVSIDFASGVCKGDGPDSYKVPAGTLDEPIVELWMSFVGQRLPLSRVMKGTNR